MRVFHRIRQFYRRFYDRFRRSLRSLVVGDLKEYNHPLLSELTSCFLSGAIEDRVRFLAKVGKKNEADVQPQVTKEYQQRVEDAIRQELQRQSAYWYSSQIAENLSRIRLPVELKDVLFSADLLEVLRNRGVFVPGRLSAWNAQVVFGILLRAIQLVTLDIIRVDYPTRGGTSDVTLSAEQSVRSALHKIDLVAKNVQSPIEIKDAGKAETELRVLIARARGGACLPLRPIPTAPLASEDLEKHYVGRPDKDALQLARQIRHADGTILVTGYRGVGKSSFVNRVIFHALSAQADQPNDSWLIVPVTVNLAKVSGVQNILRLTLRAVREALIDSENGKPRPVPSLESGKLKDVLLPLDYEREIKPLEEAYIRATYKVTLSRINSSENKMEAGSSISLDPGKILGKVVGVELGKFLEAGIKRTRTERINRELNLLDYDENAAEEDLARLIRNLAKKRPLLGKRGPEVQIKLVFIFDELDKMDIDKGLKPMIEGLKNLFLQQYSVFVLVTSKKFYYDLLKDRSIEDAMLNSYFSAIVHVPLLTYAQARNMVNDWVDWGATEQFNSHSPDEEKLISQLTRFLVYKSFGNPRDIIRELRLMQEWADAADRPYLTDQLGKSPALQIFATIQECIEKTAIPKQSSQTNPTQSDGSVSLVSESLIGNEAKDEQIRRGLYILTEELINRRYLLLESPQVSSDQEKIADTQVSAATPTLKEQFEEILKKLAQPDRSVSASSPIARLHKDNFSLVSVEEVREYARRLGTQFKEELNAPLLNETRAEPLFTMDGTNVLQFEDTFYDLTRRQPLAARSEEAVRKESPDELIIQAERFSESPSWTARLTAINLVKLLGDKRPSPKLQEFLWGVVEEDTDPDHRLAAVEAIKHGLLDENKPKRIKRLSTEKDERVLLRLVALLKTAEESKKLATDTILQLLKGDADPIFTRLQESVAIEALKALSVIADRDVSAEVFSWLTTPGRRRSELLQDEAVKTLRAIATNHNVDIADKIISDNKILAFFGAALTPESQLIAYAQPISSMGVKNYLRELLRSKPLVYAEKLLSPQIKVDVTVLLTYLWDFAYETHNEDLGRVILNQVLAFEDVSATRKELLLRSLRNTVEFQTRLLPYLNRQLDLSKEEQFKPDQVTVLKKLLKELEAAPVPKVEQPKISPFEQFIYSRTLSSLGGSEISVTRNWGATIGLGALSLVSFAVAAYFFRRDLPAGASLAQTVGSRLILLLANLSIFAPFLYSAATASMDSNQSKSDSVMPYIVPIAFALYYLHHDYIGPLTFWNQVLQILVNLPGIMFAFVAYLIPRDVRTLNFQRSQIV